MASPARVTWSVEVGVEVGGWAREALCDALELESPLSLIVCLGTSKSSGMRPLKDRFRRSLVVPLPPLPTRLDPDTVWCDGVFGETEHVAEVVEALLEVVPSGAWLAVVDLLLGPDPRPRLRRSFDVVHEGHYVEGDKVVWTMLARSRTADPPSPARAWSPGPHRSDHGFGW